MKNTFAKIFKYLILAVTLFGIVVVLFNAESLFPSKINKAYPFIITVFVYSILYLFFLKKRITFIEVFLHEFTHMLFALITLKKITGFHVAKTSGYMEYIGKRDFLVLLSPYFFSIPLAIIIPLSFLFDDSYEIYFKITVTVFYTSFVLKTIYVFSFSEPDITNSGIIFSVLFIVFMHILLFAVIASYIFYDFSNFSSLFYLKPFYKLL